MNDPALLEAHRELLLQLSRDWFLVLQFGFLAIAGVLAWFLIAKRARMGSQGALRPLGFAALMIVLLGSTAVFTKLWGFDHAIFAFGFAAGLALSLADPVVAVAFLVANSLIRPWEMSDVAEMAFLPKTLFAVAIGSWAFHAARTRRLSVLMNRPCLLFYSLALWFLFSALLAGDFMEGLTKYSGNVLIAVIVFFLISNAPEKDDDINLLRRVLVVSVCALITHAILATVTQADYDPAAFRLEDAGTVGNSNDLAALITFALPFALVPALKAGQGLAGKLSAFVSIPILLAGLWVSQSRGAILALVLGGIVYGVSRAKNKRRAAVLAAFCAVVLAALSSLLTFSRDADDLQGSTNSRISFILAGINMGLRNPIMGIGHDNFSASWDAYAIGQTYESGLRSGHSTWLIAFAENGFPGLLILLALFVSSFRRALQVQGEHPELVFALVAYGVAMTFLNHVYTIYPYMLFALALAAARIQDRAQDKGGSKP